MLLRALCEFYSRAKSNGLIEDPAFNKKFVRWVIPLDLEGNVLGGLIENPEPKKGGSLLSVPRTSRPKVGGGVAEFLCDGIEAVFGLPQDPSKKESKNQQENRQKKTEDFWEQIENCYEETKSPLIDAILKSREKIKDFLRWGKLDEKEKETWLIKTSDGTEAKFKNGDIFTFQVNGSLVVNKEELRAYWRKQYEKEIAESKKDAEVGVCLATGQENVAIQASHLPKIQGVPGATSTGATLVSFDKDAFRSYGFEQSYNAPVSFEAVEAYTNAMNYLLQDRKHHLRIGNTAILFWAEKSEEASDIFSELFESPNEEVIRRFLSQPLRGTSDYGDFEDEQFYSVTINGNAGRIIVRDWIQIPVSSARQNFRKWFEDLQIIPLKSHAEDKIPPLSLFRLAVSTVKDAKDLLSETVTDLYSCAIRGKTPSISLAIKLLNRIKTEIASSGLNSLYNLSRFALLKLVINRNKKENEPMIEYKLNEQITDVAYNCGRLLAVFGELQKAAHEYKLKGPGIVERYYGIASTAPNSAFPILWRLHQHHLSKLSREKPTWAKAYERKIADIVKNFKSDGTEAPEFPVRFDLKAQGRFALGFYQQIAYEYEARKKQNIQEGDKEDE
ncbi:MAG: type I-C CRISPR-associated protein Cas8c/Csd1 [Acidobacteriota bacterium]|nr:type I-C CRISPR-associated protein Cas8c/Csd1 [Acidobacteriota bacterium]